MFGLLSIRKMKDALSRLVAVHCLQSLPLERVVVEHVPRCEITCIDNNMINNVPLSVGQNLALACDREQPASK